MKVSSNGRIIRVLSFDPGTGNLGWALNEHDIDNNATVVPKFGTIVGKNVYRKVCELMPGADKRFTILEGMEVIIADIITTTKPDFIVTEDTFFNPIRPAAFQSLSLVIGMLQRLAWRVSKKIIYKYPPQHIKKVVTQYGMAQKCTVRENLIEQGVVIKDSRQSPISKLDEHSSDAIAAGRTFILTDLPILIAEHPELFVPNKK